MDPPLTHGLDELGFEYQIQFQYIIWPRGNFWEKLDRILTSNGHLCTEQVGSEKVSWAEQICSCLWQRISVAEDMYLYIWQSTFYVTYDRAGWKWAGELSRAGACDCVQAAKESCHLSTPPSPPTLRSSSFSRWSCFYKITSKDDHSTWFCQAKLVEFPNCHVSGCLFQEQVGWGTWLSKAALCQQTLHLHLAVHPPARLSSSGIVAWSKSDWPLQYK